MAFTIVFIKIIEVNLHLKNKEQNNQWKHITDM